MSHTRASRIEAIGRVIDTLDRLRVECPWDKKQTNESLRPNTIEEVFELSDALLAEDNENIKKELGDVLLHVLFYAKIGNEKNSFDIEDVADALNKKLIFRHPHIFGDVKVNDSHDVEQNWEQIKLKEKGGNKTVLSGVPVSLPPLIKSYRIQEKAANVGFDWETPSQVWDKVKEEISEFEEAVEGMSHSQREEEMGDLLFSLVNAARLYNIHPDTALERTNKKFIKRFNYIESKLKEKNQNIKDLPLELLDDLWNEAKRQHDDE